jgi:hypothetical protein
MHAIKMNRQELLAIVKANKEKHIAEFTEAVSDFKEAVLKISQDNLKLAKTADLEKFKKIEDLPPEPQSYENSYKRAIRMLELSVEDTIEVEEDVFNQLVLDEWNWKSMFSASNTMIKSYATFGGAAGAARH